MDIVNWVDAGIPAAHLTVVVSAAAAGGRPFALLFAERIWHGKADS